MPQEILDIDKFVLHPAFPSRMPTRAGPKNQPFMLKMTGFRGMELTKIPPTAGQEQHNNKKNFGKRQG